MSNSQPTSVPTNSRPSPVTNGTSNNAQGDAAYTNGHQHHHHGTTTNPPSSLPKKGKAKKQADPDDAAKAVAARLAQLESNVADEKDQEAEIGGSISFLKLFSMVRIFCWMWSGQDDVRPVRPRSAMNRTMVPLRVPSLFL